jgi:hypothetical protein
MGLEVKEGGSVPVNPNAPPGSPDGPPIVTPELPPARNFWQSDNAGDWASEWRDNVTKVDVDVTGGDASANFDNDRLGNKPRESDLSIANLAAATDSGDNVNRSEIDDNRQIGAWTHPNSPRRVANGERVV